MMNSPWGGGGLDAGGTVSTDGSRRNSLNVNHSMNGSSSYGQQDGGSKMSQHLSRLHKKAQDHQAMAAATKQPANHAAPPPQHQQQQHSSRRASDPVRALDRNFGVGNQQSKPQRSGSFTQINDQSRMPMHGQPYHGSSSFQQPGTQPPVRPASVSGQLQFSGQYGPNNGHQQYSMQGFYNNQELWNNAGYGNFGQYGQNEYGHWPGQHAWHGQQGGQGRQWPSDWQQRSTHQGQQNSYQRTLEYVQQCQSSWNGHPPPTPTEHQQQSQF